MPSSDIELAPLDDMSWPVARIHAGWNGATHSYWASVLEGGRRDGERVQVVDLGTTTGSVNDPEQIVEALRPYAVVPDDLAALLTQSRELAFDNWTDLRPGSSLYLSDADLKHEWDLLNTPGGYATPLRYGATTSPEDHGWKLESSWVTVGSHDDEYIKGDHAMTLSWTTHDPTTDYLLSPVDIDGTKYGVDSYADLDRLMASGGADSQPVPTAMENRIDSVLDGILIDPERAAESTPLDESLFDDARFDDARFDENAGEDDGFCSGMGY